MRVSPLLVGFVCSGSLGEVCVASGSDGSGVAAGVVHFKCSKSGARERGVAAVSAGHAVASVGAGRAVGSAFRFVVLPEVGLGSGGETEVGRDAGRFGFGGGFVHFTPSKNGDWVQTWLRYSGFCGGFNF